MPIRTLARRCVLTFAVVTIAASCASTEMGDEQDAGSDVSTADSVQTDVPLLGDGVDDVDDDTPAPDVSADAADDVDEDVALDSESDVGDDATTDVSDDAATDTVDDATDSGEDAATDVTVDVDDDTESDADTAGDVADDTDHDTAADTGDDTEEDTDVESDVVESFCGDGTVDEGEACDDGNDIDADECNSLCEARGDDPCAPCTEDAECGFGDDLCVSLSDGDFCATSCAGGCAEGEACVEVGDEGWLQCVPAAGWCERCPDDDRDTICDEHDVCAGGDDRSDSDSDGIPDGCDTCPDDPDNDTDGDSVCGDDDVCPGFDDRVDNNENGTPDGCDPSSELFCDNGIDDDNDGDIDCEDPDCEDACLVTACELATLAADAGAYSGNTTDGPTTLSGSCGVDGRAPEAVVTFTAPRGGAWCVDTFASTFDTRLSVRTTCDDASSELICTDDTGALRQSEAEIELLAEQVVYVIVEGYDGASGDYTLTITEGACPVPGEVCDNGTDDDDDDAVDCDDEDCAEDPACFEVVCDDGIDNDDDGPVDCADDDCVGNIACIEACDDGIDNDVDGDTDCADDECILDPACFELVCDDEADNDGDGDIDCDDTDCGGTEACPGPPELCANLVDDDGDGAIDCADPDCIADPACNQVGVGTCDAPFVLSGIGTRTGDTSAATNDAVSTCQTNNNNDHVWRFEPPAAGSYCAETVGTAFDTILYARTVCTDTATEFVCNDDAVGLQSQIDLTLDSTAPVFVWMDGYGTASGEYTLNVREGTCSGLEGPCDDVGTIGLEPVTGTTVESTADVTLSCGLNGNGPARVYTFTPPVTETYCANSNGSTFDTRLGILSACDGVELGCDDDSGIGTQSVVQFDGVAGTPVTIVLEGFGAASGDFTLTVAGGVSPDPV